MFVTFEGIDGSGKTTQAELLADGSRRRAARSSHARAGRHASSASASASSSCTGATMTPWAEAALFAAARAELVARVIRPALERGADVVCDRYVDSSLAYQGIARGLGLDAVLELNLRAIAGLLPDRTFLLARRPGARGRAACGASRDRIEREGDALPRAGRRRLPRARRALPGAHRPLDRRHAPPDELAARDPCDSFDAVPEQAEAKRLLAAALAEGPAHAYLFHGPAGVGKRRARARVRGASCSAATRGSRRAHPDLYVLEPLGDQIRIDDDPRAAARPAHAAVRGRPARLPRLRRAPDERGRRRRAAQGSRGAAGVRRDRPRRRRARPAAGDDPLALPARPVPAALRAGRPRGGRGARAGALARASATALARVAAGRLDRVERLLDPSRRRAARRCSRRRAPSTVDPGVRAGRRRRQPCSRRARERGDEAKEPRRRLEGLDLPAREAEQRVRRAAARRRARGAARLARGARRLVPRPRRRRRRRRARRRPRRPARGAARGRRPRSASRPPSRLRSAVREAWRLVRGVNSRPRSRSRRSLSSSAERRGSGRSGLSNPSRGNLSSSARFPPEFASLRTKQLRRRRTGEGGVMVTSARGRRLAAAIAMLIPHLGDVGLADRGRTAVIQTTT